MTDLMIALASSIVDEALNSARSRGLAPLCVMVIDTGAWPVMMKRDDGASIFRARIAEAKAAACLGMGFGGRELARRAAGAPAFYAALGEVAPLGILPVPGGVLIRDSGGKLLGAVGISGDTADHDEQCAIAGIVAAGLVADTGAPA